MLDDQLDRGAAAIVIAGQAISQVDMLAGRVAVPATEMDRVDRARYAGQAQFQLQVPFLQYAPVGHFEVAVEQRLGEALAPRSSKTQRVGVAMVEFVRRVKPVFGIWYHQDLNVISPSTGLEGRLRRTYASLTGLPMKRITGGTYTGVAGTWQRRAHPRGMTMIVELGPTLDATQAQTHADAVVTVSELLHSQWK